MLADEIFASELGGRATTSARAIEELLTEIATGLLGFNQWMGLSLGLCSQGEFVAGHLAYQYAEATRAENTRHEGSHSQSAESIIALPSYADFAARRSRLTQQIRGRAVILIGAAPTSGCIEQELDHFDVVAQTKAPVETAAGSRPRDLNYLNGQMERAVVSSTDFQQIRGRSRTLDTRWFLTKRKPLLPHLDNFLPIVGYPAYVYGPVMIGQRAIADILLMSPESLMLRGFDFYGGTESHAYESWPQQYQRSLGEQHTAHWYCRSLGQHHVFAHLRLCQELHSLGAINVGAETALAMQQSTQQLAERLERKFRLRTLP
jgi:hypothetical protein